MLIICRLRKSKHSASGAHKTRLISNSTNSRSLMSVLPPTHRSIVARRVLLVPMMERSIIHNLRDKCVRFVKCVRSVLQQAASGFLCLGHREKYIHAEVVSSNDCRSPACIKKCHGNGLGTIIGRRVCLYAFGTVVCTLPETIDNE